MSAVTEIYVTPARAAEMMGVTRQVVYLLIREGAMRGRLNGRRWHVRADDVWAWVRAIGRSEGGPVA